MTELNYYSPLATVNESEQKTLIKMRTAFNAAIEKSNSAQTNMIADYIGDNKSRRLCYTECSKGWSTDTNSFISEIKTDAAPTRDTPSQGLLEVTNSCKAGCDLKWPKTVQSVASILGIAKTTGLYTSAAGKEHEITHCNDLAQFAPPTDCAVSDYSWSICSKDCGPGTKTGTRTIITEPQNGGKACPALSQSQSCNNGSCDPPGPAPATWKSALAKVPYGSKSFIGGMKEGFTPLQGDFVKACEDAGTRGGKRIPGTTKPGYSLVEDRRHETESFNRLKSTQQQIKKSINQMQSKNLGANSLYKTQNIILLKKLASYEQTIHKLLQSGSNLDTLDAQQSDSLLRKNSVDMSYYLWLTLAISILGFAITKIK